MANEHIKICLKSIVIREMLIEASKRYHYPSTLKWLKNKKQRNLQIPSNGKGTEFSYLPMAIENSTFTLENSLAVS